MDDSTEECLQEGEDVSAEHLEGEQPPPPAPRTSISGKALLGLIGLIWSVELLLGVVLGVITYLQTGSVEEENFSMPLLLVVMGLSWTFTLLFCTYIGCTRYNISFARGFSIRRVNTQAIKRSILLGIGFSICAMIVSAVGVQDVDVPIAKLFENDAASHASGIPWFFMLFAIVVAPLEELYYRGFLFRAFQGLIGTAFSAILVVLWFGLIHGMQVGGNVLLIAVIMTLGGVCTYLRIRYNSVVPSMVCHFCYNLMLMGISFVGVLVEG